MLQRTSCSHVYDEAAHKDSQDENPGDDQITRAVHQSDDHRLDKYVRYN